MLLIPVGLGLPFFRDICDFVLVFGDDVAIGEPGLNKESVTLADELIDDNELSSLVSVESELKLFEVLTLKVSKIPVEKFGTPQFIQHHEMSLEPRMLYIF